MILEIVELGGMVVTYGLGLLRGRKKGSGPGSSNGSGPGSSQPICGCNHHMAMHDPVSGHCNEKHYHGSTYSWVKCDCLQYVGPKPVDSFFASEVNWTESVMRTKPPTAPTSATPTSGTAPADSTHAPAVVPVAGQSSGDLP